MKSTTPLRFASALLAALAVGGVANAQSQSPYVETTSLTFLWNMVRTTIGSTTIPAGVSPGTGLDPSLYNPDLPISTDTGGHSLMTEGQPTPIGAQPFFIEQISQALIRARVTQDGSGNRGTALITRKEQLPARWQLLAVREAPKTVEEIATNPYKIYLSVLDRTDNNAPRDPLAVDSYSAEIAPDIIGDIWPTGMTLTLGQWAASGTVKETQPQDYVTVASGKVTTAFTINYGSLFYEDPRHNAQDNPGIHQYHLKRHAWNMFASGHIVYNIRSVPSPSGGAFMASNVSLTGTGGFHYIGTTVEIENEAIKRIVINSNRAGLAPLTIKMSNIQYQDRRLFPGF